MKYQLTPKVAQFNNEGFVVVEGWALIYNTDTKTGEFINATYEYVAEGIGLPAHACLDAPNSVDDEHAIVRVDDEWTYPADHRGKKIYSIENGAESTVTEIGDIPNDYTPLKPNSEFDSWDGEKWVLDENKQHHHYVMLASVQKNQLLSEASSQIDYLQDAIDTEIATDEEKTLYAAWKKYRALLNRIDVDAAPDIEWPQNYAAVAAAQKKQLLSEAGSQIDYLQDAIDKEIATDEEKTLYAAWKKYRVLLNRIDVDAAPEITWPEKP